ncbi:hypothetical protein ACI2UM_24110 [Ralstonia nicotianae]
MTQRKVKELAANATENPRDNVRENYEMLYHTQEAILDVVEGRYGKCDDAIDTYMHPVLRDMEKNKHTRSQIGSLKSMPATFGVSVGSFAESWEQVFYELCHETVHLLNPVRDIKQSRVSALEEGVAVKFAEEMYEAFIATYTRHGPLVTPAADKSSSYFRAFSIAKKIPDDVLKRIRKEFGKFSAVDDASLLMKIAPACITEHEAQQMCDAFDYSF